MSFVVDPSAREAFAPRELVEAYKNFEKGGPQYLDAETGLRDAAYRFGERLLIVCEESEAGVVVLIHATSWKGNSADFVLRGFSEVASVHVTMASYLRWKG